MVSRIQFGDRIHDLSMLSEHGRATFEMLRFTERRLEDCKAREDALKRAMNVYVAELKAEIVRDNTGIDLSTLFSD
jgi:hypothetical protein